MKTWRQNWQTPIVLVAPCVPRSNSCSQKAFGSQTVCEPNRDVAEDGVLCSFLVWEFESSKSPSDRNLMRLSDSHVRKSSCHAQKEGHWFNSPQMKLLDVCRLLAWARQGVTFSNLVLSKPRLAWSETAKSQRCLRDQNLANLVCFGWAWEPTKAA